MTVSDSIWARQIGAMQGRVATLYRSAAAGATRCELLLVAFEELQAALEELKVMHEELCEQHGQLLNTREQIEAELQAARLHFDHAPVAYLITNLNGTIRQANHAAAALFHSAQKAMVGRSLALFVPEGERRAFRERLAQLRLHGAHQEVWEARMQPWGGTCFQAVLTIACAHGPLGHPRAIRWIVQDAAAYPRSANECVSPQAAPGGRAQAVGDLE